MATQNMQVKNTFIDIPGASERTPLPSPLATAPARNAGSLQDSLKQAAEDPARSAVRRAKPNPLNFCSQSSMMSIAESPNGQALIIQKDPAQFMSGQSSVPATPAYNWGVLQTPTETPMGFGATSQVYTAPPVYVASPSGGVSFTGMTAVATPTGGASFPPMTSVATGATFPARTTLSLQDMIQSPKVEQKTALLNSTYQQLYNQGQQIPVYAPQMMAAPVDAPQMAPAPIGCQAYSEVSMASVAQPPTMPPMMQAPPGPPVQMVHPGPPVTMPGAPGSNACASVALGLVTGNPPQGYAQVNSPVVASMPPLLPPSPPQMAPGPMFQSGIPGQQMQASAPAQAPQPQMQQVGYPPNYGQPMYGAPPLQAPMAPPVISPGITANIPPPPPNFAAPTVVMSPKAASSPGAAGASESDIKVMLEVAVASGNQEAIQAVMRQAQQAGMSAEKFRSLLPAPQTTA
mmetsp:Transcript_85774/g.151937  ORF Transcript_85774/g.151937 Transcript_85774/m.151937 type:complete len:460 (-) Transcript_85774:49-1428(-)